MGKFAEKACIITGGASGIGEATSVLFAREGCSVIIADIDMENGKRVSDSIAHKGGVSRFIKHDVTSEDSWRALIAEVEKEYGRLDVLVNNAGIGFAGTITEMSYAEWQTVMRINLDSVFLGLKYSLEMMRKAGRGGAIINVSSVAGIVAAPGAAAYCASKAGIRLLTKSAALESAAAGDGIRINSVHPAAVDTPIWKKSNWWNEFSRAHGGDEKAMEIMAKNSPLKRMAKPEEIAAGILYLAADESGYVTGAELVIDGGFSIQ
ncbi:MAG TPA: SDR family oxidoreductase [Candidatus Omnitrophota bacterium]|nr:SDR family oxidoreductase [Candidatus Omnitrophota bacterium]